MAARASRSLIFAGFLSLANMLPVRAEPVPTPVEPLRDYQALGVIQVDLPPSPEAVKAKDGKLVKDPGFQIAFQFRQEFVWPDRLLQLVEVFGQVQATLVLANTERTYSPTVGIIIEKTFKNLDDKTESPIAATQMSMATWAKLLPELKTGKVLPDESDFVKARAATEQRIKELDVERTRLLENKKNPENQARAGAVAAEMARLRDDIRSMEIRRTAPCYVVEFDNAEIAPTLLSRGLMGGRGVELLNGGKTRVWVTKQHGLPIKIETSEKSGHILLSVTFTNMQVNAGRRPSDLFLNVPPDAKRVQVIADVKERDWEERMEKSINDQVELLRQQEMQKKQLGGAPGFGQLGQLQPGSGQAGAGQPGAAKPQTDGKSKKKK